MNELIHALLAMTAIAAFGSLGVMLAIFIGTRLKKLKRLHAWLDEPKFLALCAIIYAAAAVLIVRADGPAMGLTALFLFFFSVVLVFFCPQKNPGKLPEWLTGERKSK